eukprot:scaffold94143_cov31-Tisochrysis_lutea.AAC.3
MFTISGITCRSLCLASLVHNTTPSVVLALARRLGSYLARGSRVVYAWRARLKSRVPYATRTTYNIEIAAD